MTLEQAAAISEGINEVFERALGHACERIVRVSESTDNKHYVVIVECLTTKGCRHD